MVERPGLEDHEGDDHYQQQCRDVVEGTSHTVVKQRTQLRAGELAVGGEPGRELARLFRSLSADGAEDDDRQQQAERSVYPPDSVAEVAEVDEPEPEAERKQRPHGDEQDADPGETEQERYLGGRRAAARRFEGDTGEDYAGDEQESPE